MLSHLPRHLVTELEPDLGGDWRGTGNNKGHQFGLTINDRKANSSSLQSILPTDPFFPEESGVYDEFVPGGSNHVKRAKGIRQTTKKTKKKPTINREKGLSFCLLLELISQTMGKKVGQKMRMSVRIYSSKDVEV